MKKHIPILLCCLLFMSCQTSQYTGFSHIVTIRRSSTEENAPISYFIMKDAPSMFVIHLPDNRKMIIGNWKAANGIVFLNPMYEYYTDKDRGMIRDITLSKSDYITFPENCLTEKSLQIDKIEYHTTGCDSAVTDSCFTLEATEYIKIPQKVPKRKKLPELL